MRKNNAPVISHLRNNEYLLKGTPDQDTLLSLVNEQNEAHIIIRVEGGNIRDLPGSILPFPSGNGYLVFKKLYEVNKRPAIYLLPELAKPLITAPKDSVIVNNDGVKIAGMEFTFEVDAEPVGYINLPSGKTILFRPYQKAAVVPECPVADTSNSPPTTPAITPVVTGTVAASPSDDLPNRVLAIINDIASDERNLTLLKDIAYTAFAIISKVKNSGAASKEEVAACVVAALTDADTRSRLRRIGSDIFRRFNELNKEAGFIVQINSGYRFTPDGEVILDEYPDDDMITAVRAGMKTEIIKAHINYDRTLGSPNSLLKAGDADFGYMFKNMLRLDNRNADEKVVFTFLEKFARVDVIYVGHRGEGFIALFMYNNKVFEVSSSPASSVFGCYLDEHCLPLLYMSNETPVAENMPVCADILQVTQSYVGHVINALPDKVIRVINPHKDDTKALMMKGYKVGTENKNDTWVLWGFPAGKTLNVNGLPRAITAGVPQY